MTSSDRPHPSTLQSPTHRFAADGSRRLLIVDLPSLASLDGVELDTRSKDIRLLLPGQEEYLISLPLELSTDAGAPVAKFSRKRHQLTLIWSSLFSSVVPATARIAQTEVATSQLLAERQVLAEKIKDEQAKVQQMQQQLAHEAAARREAEVRASDLQHEIRILQLQVAGSGRACQSFEWKYEQDNAGTWCSFGVEANEEMQKAYIQYLRSGDNHVAVMSGGAARTINFAVMEQTNVRTNTHRKIKLKLRVPISWTTVPKRLIQQSAETFSMYVRETNANVWQAMAQLLTGTAHPQPQFGASICSAMASARIQQIWRIENFALWQKYSTQLAHMEEDHKRFVLHIDDIFQPLGCISPQLQAAIEALDRSYQYPMRSSVNEKWVFHGTSYVSADHIVQNGFDNRVCKQGMYGAGVYFASESCKSNQYASVDQWGCRNMIVARVGLGDPYYTTETLSIQTRRPPQRDGNGHGLYDSVIANPGRMRGHQRGYQDHQEFVIFESTQAYPSFIVSYKVP